MKGFDIIRFLLLIIMQSSFFIASKVMGDYFLDVRIKLLYSCGVPLKMTSLESIWL